MKLTISQTTFVEVLSDLRKKDLDLGFCCQIITCWTVLDYKSTLSVELWIFCDESGFLKFCECLSLTLTFPKKIGKRAGTFERNLSILLLSYIMNRCKPLSFTPQEPRYIFLLLNLRGT